MVAPYEGLRVMKVDGCQIGAGLTCYENSLWGVNFFLFKRRCSVCGQGNSAVCTPQQDPTQHGGGLLREGPAPLLGLEPKRKF